VSRLRRGHPGAFDEVYRLHRDAIWRFLCKLAGSKQLAEDLFQDTWLAAARNAHRLREDTDLGPWLYTIARNKHRNMLRFGAFEARRRAGVSAEPMGAAPLPDAEADLRRRARRMAEAFDGLTEAHREILLLSVDGGLETREIARILDIREEAVRKRLSRARSELQRRTDEGSARKDRRP